MKIKNQEVLRWVQLEEAEWSVFGYVVAKSNPALDET